MKLSVKKKILYFAKLGLGIGLVAWIMLLVDLQVFFEYFQQLTIYTVLLIGFITLLSLYLQYLRWRYLLYCNSNSIAKGDLIPSFFAGFSFRLMLPGGHAEVSKIVLLQGKKNGKVLAFGLEKLFQTFIKLFLVFTVLPFAFPRLTLYCIGVLIILTSATLFVPKLRIFRRFQEKKTNYYAMLTWTLILSLLMFILMVSQYYILINTVNSIAIWPTTLTSIYLWGSGMIPISIA